MESLVELDASLGALGGVYGNLVYTLPIPQNYNAYSIVHLEILNILVACKIFSQQWANAHIHVKCDNMAVVEVLNKGKTRDHTLGIIARNIWLITAMFNIKLTVSHIPGKDNVIADLLSRWTYERVDNQKLLHLLPQHQWVPTHLDLTLLIYNI